MALRARLSKCRSLVFHSAITSIYPPQIVNSGFSLLSESQTRLSSLTRRGFVGSHEPPKAENVNETGSKVMSDSKCADSQGGNGGKPPPPEPIREESSSLFIPRSSGIWGYIQVLGAETAIQTQLERSFRMQNFMADAKQAIVILMEKFMNADFEGINGLVSPQLNETLIKLYADFRATPEAQRAEAELEPLHEAEVLKADFTQVSVNNLNGYKMEEVVPVLEGYHSSIFVVLRVNFDLELRTRYFDKDKHLRVEVRNKTTRIVEFARQCPRLVRYNDPLEEVVSPWFIVGIAPSDVFL